MEPTLKQVTLESLSDVRPSFWLGTYVGKEHSAEVLVVRFEGTFGFGCKGNPDATFMVAMGTASLEAFEPQALIVDLSLLHYEWGDMMDCVLAIGGDKNRKLPRAVVVGEHCRRAIGTLCYGVDSPKDPCEEEWIFDRLDEAWAYVTQLLDGDGTPEIHRAARNGDHALVRKLMADGEKPNRTDSAGQAPLHVACDPAIVRLLIESGAEVKVRDTSGRTPLHQDLSAESVRLLLDAGADPDARSRWDASPLHHVKSPEAARVLIAAGADIHLRSRKTLLHSVRQPEMAKVFIEAGADVNAVDERGQTPLDQAEANRQQFEWQMRHGHRRDAEAVREYGEIVALLRSHGARSGLNQR